MKRFTYNLDDLVIDIQSTYTNTYVIHTKSGYYMKRPKVKSHAWCRVWKDNKLIKIIECEKYLSIQELKKYIANLGYNWNKKTAIEL